MMMRSWIMGLGLATAFAAAGCGFHPLYGDMGNKSGGREVFGSVYVESIPTERIGYELRNNLISQLHGSVKPDEAKYRLTVTTTQGNEGIAVEPDASITRYNFNLVAHYALTDVHDGKVVQTGSEATLSEYDVVSSPYSTLVAERAAEQHATEDIANRIRVDLAVYFHNQAK